MIDNKNIEARTSLVYYLDLIEENKSLKEDIKHLKKLALKRSESSTIWRYDELELERIIDPEDWAFGLRHYEKLLESGLTMEELIDYIKERREFYEKEEE